jgi:hypothetical protein
VLLVRGAALDVVALVEAWLFDVGSVCRYVKTLAGHTASLEQQQDSQARGWLPVVQPNGIGSSRCSFMSPLVASSDAASHATHLYAQLSLHRACRDGLLGLKATLEQQADATGGGMHAHTCTKLITDLLNWPSPLMSFVLLSTPTHTHCLNQLKSFSLSLHALACIITKCEARWSD